MRRLRLPLSSALCLMTLKTCSTKTCNALAYTLAISACFLFPINNAFACIPDPNSYSPPAFVIAFIVCIFIVSVFSLIAWGIKRIFLRNTNTRPFVYISAFIFSILLGCIGSFAVPVFKQTFSGFTEELPIQTVIVISGWPFMWLPILILCALWFLTKNTANKTGYFVSALFIEANLLLLVLWALYSPLFQLGSIC
jgi:hypothetical protein